MQCAYFGNHIKGRYRLRSRKFRDIGDRLFLGMVVIVEGAVMLGSGDDAISFSLTDWFVERLYGDDILLTPKSEMQKGKPGKRHVGAPITDKRTSDAIWFHLGAGLNTTPADILYGILMSNQRRVRGSVENVFKYRGDTFFEGYPLIMHIVVSAFPYIIKLFPLTVESVTAVMTPSISKLIYSYNDEIIPDLHRRLALVVCSDAIDRDEEIPLKTKMMIFYMLINHYRFLECTTRTPIQYEDHDHNKITVDVYHLKGGVFQVSGLSPGDDIRKKLIVQYPTFLERNDIPTDSPSPEEAFNIHCISSSEVCNNVGWAMYLYGLITKPEVYIHFK